MLEFDRIDMSGENYVSKTNGSCSCIICNHYYFFKANFRFQPKYVMVVMI